MLKCMKVMMTEQLTILKLTVNTLTYQHHHAMIFCDRSTTSHECNYEHDKSNSNEYGRWN